MNINVSNRKCIRRLSIRSLWAARGRNLIAILAIALTTVLFTALLTIAVSMNDSFQESNFRQVGGYSHGGFKGLTAEQAEELKADPMIKDYGLRKIVGTPMQAPFNKTYVEISYVSPNTAKWMYAEPTEGKLPVEGTGEAATDTRVLSLLGIEPVLGAEFTMIFDVGGHEVTESFILSGWWTADEAAPASHVLIPESRAEEILGRFDPASFTSSFIGTWGMDVMLASSTHIEGDLNTILESHGYTSDRTAEGSTKGAYVDIGVNWGYTGAQFYESIDVGMILSMGALLALIVFTGYLIIYNVFQISVSSDIRFYGLLKTIGTTGRQLRRIIRMQALALALAGIPLGLLLGYGVGAVLTPVVLSRLSGFVPDAVSLNPAIFAGAAVFALVTVLISCRRPGRMAAKVSPVEAVRYTEAGGKRRTVRRSQKPASLVRMAFANLGRSKKKTFVTVLSLSLAVVLLSMTVTFTNGFDMDKYISRQMTADFILADAGYFQVGNPVMFNPDMALPEEVISQVESQSGVTGGRTYGLTIPAEEPVPEDFYRAMWESWYSKEIVDDMVAEAEKTGDGRLMVPAQLYGMEAYARSKLTLIEGDLAKLDEPDSNYIAAVYTDDDYGVPHMDSNWAKIGDRFAIRYVEEYEYFDPATGEIFPDGPEENREWSRRAKVYRDVEYEVAALVIVPYSLSYRHGGEEFILNEETFRRDTGTSDVMYYALDIMDEGNAPMEAFLQDFTTNVQPQYNYESKLTYAEEFESFRNMFALLGGVLCSIIGLVGVLNFLNAVLTGILARRREFAVLQSIGMTGRQLKTMLVWEGLFYTLSSIVATLILVATTGPLVGSLLTDLFWFFTYKFTLLPVLAVLPVFAILGVLLPLIAYRFVAKRSVIERLREAEG